MKTKYEEYEIEVLPGKCGWCYKVTDTKSRDWYMNNKIKSDVEAYIQARELVALLVEQKQHDIIG